MKKLIMPVFQAFLLLSTVFFVSCAEINKPDLDENIDQAKKDDSKNFGDRGTDTTDKNNSKEDSDNPNSNPDDDDNPVGPTRDNNPVIDDSDDPKKFDPDDDEDICGDGILDPTEECDDDNTTGGDGCSATCKNECGDGELDSDNSDGYSEECDDDNITAGDGCSATCTDECGDGVVDADDSDGYSEECDDSNLVAGDGCSATCADECGDGTKDSDDSDGYSEECDDGNISAGDGCSAVCESEAVVVASSRQTLSVGYEHICVIDATTKAAKCFGQNTDGQLGQENTTDIGDGVGPAVSAAAIIDIGTGLGIELVSAGGDNTIASTCMVTNLNTLKCFGGNSAGQLGKANTDNLGDEASEMGTDLDTIDMGTGRTVQDISSGTAFHCALLDDDSIKCWGDNSAGQLGQGNTDSLGDGAGEMGDNLTAIDLGTGRSAANIYAGALSACVILDNASVKCWGDNGSGTLGQGNTDDLGDGAGEMGDNLAAINLGTNRTATALAMGTAHVCALLDDASVKCWGEGSNGALGSGATADLGGGPGEMGDALTAIDLGTGRTALDVAAGDNHSCALLDNNSVKCWGANTAGQLGQESTDDLGDGAGEMGDNLIAIDLGSGRTATAIAAGGSTTCALLDNSAIKCWGSNTAGQLGQNSTDNLGDAGDEMGDDLTAISFGF